jgi:murein DD-endopeptidase MepM/ murein hydrolase activator NlpD
MSSFKFQAWPTEFRSINQYFGANPQNYAQFGLPGHEGIDIMAPTGSKVFSVAPGTVKMVQADPAGHNYGKHIRIEHADGYETIYAHLQDVSVRAGQAVEAGSLLGTADNTGNSFGSHLHLTLKHRGKLRGIGRVILWIRRRFCCLCWVCKDRPDLLRMAGLIAMVFSWSTIWRRRMPGASI